VDDKDGLLQILSPARIFSAAGEKDSDCLHELLLLSIAALREISKEKCLQWPFPRVGLCPQFLFSGSEKENGQTGLLHSKSPTQLPFMFTRSIYKGVNRPSDRVSDVANGHASRKLLTWHENPGLLLARPVFCPKADQVWDTSVMQG